AGGRAGAEADLTRRRRARVLELQIEGALLAGRGVAGEPAARPGKHQVRLSGDVEQELRLGRKVTTRRRDGDGILPRLDAARRLHADGDVLRCARIQRQARQLLRAVALLEGDLEA